jgi:hypothetical protein
MPISTSPEPTASILIRPQNRLNILHGGTLACMVDLGGSLAVASRGLFATGVSTDLSGKAIYHCAGYDGLFSVIMVLMLMPYSVTYHASGGKIGAIPAFYSSYAAE